MKDLSNEIMIHKKSGNLEYLQFRRLLEYEDILIHAFTTRLGGVSTDYNSSLNFSFTTDNRENVLQNYELICNELNINVENIVCTSQNHSDIVEVVTKNNLGAGIFKDYIKDYYDGLITNEKGAILRTVCADCTLVILFDPIKRVLSNIHAGWKGVVNEIIPNAVKKMIGEYDCNSKDIIACCGPSINKCCFEFDLADISYFNKYRDIKNVISNHKDKEKCYIDTNEIIRYQLKQNNLREENINISNICTMCNKDVFFSHRGDMGKTGRQILIAGLK